MVENARKSVWSRNRETGEFRLEDEEGVVRARFDDLSEAFSDRTKYDGLASEYDEDELGRDGPHLTVNEPVVPGREFEGGLPTTEDFRIVIVPAGYAGEEPLETLEVTDEKGVRPLPDAADSPGWVSDVEGSLPESDSGDKRSSTISDLRL